MFGIEKWYFDVIKLICCNSLSDYTNNLITKVIIDGNINIIDFTASFRQIMILLEV